MLDLPPEDPADRPSVCGMMVGGDAQRPSLRDVDEAPEEAPSRVLVALLAQHRVDQLPVTVDRPVEVAPAAGDLHVGLVDVPGPARVAASLGAEPFPQQRCEPRFPATNGLVRDLVATLEQQLRDISEAELVAQPPQHGEQHDVGRIVELVEAGAGPLVEPPPAGAAAEPAVAELRAVSPLGCRARSTVRTGHGRLLVLAQTRLPRARPEI